MDGTSAYRMKNRTRTTDGHYFKVGFRPVPENGHQCLMAILRTVVLYTRNLLQTAGLQRGVGILIAITGESKNY